MRPLKDYFEEHRYQSKYEFGTRIYGEWNKIPFIGTIYGDSVINPTFGPRLVILLDLPIKFDKVVYSVIIDKHKNVKNIKRLVNIDDENTCKPSKGKKK